MDDHRSSSNVLNTVGEAVGENTRTGGVKMNAKRTSTPLAANKWVGDLGGVPAEPMTRQNSEEAIGREMEFAEKYALTRMRSACRYRTAKV